MNQTIEYRYPGSRPFLDTDLDRKLFFGRDQEQAELLHLILAHKLVVLFAKSGTGKTSLLNAGVLQPLRERGFFPIKVRFNDPNMTPLQTVYAGIQDSAVQQQVELVPSADASLWHYFKTTEFWSHDDKLLRPVIILDQFEDFFDFYTPEHRQALICQLADLLKGITLKNLQDIVSAEEETTYTDSPPDIKILIALREDYLGQLEELAPDLPAILDHRFRLTALRRQQAQDAIEQPAQLQDAALTTAGFRYAPDAVIAILDFLCKRKERDKIVLTDEVEPSQLQLLCQHLETKIQQQQKTIVQLGDLGGERGMQKVLQNFYDRQLKRIKFRKRRRVRKLCEKGLLSRSNRRLSLQEEDISRRFKARKTLLADLVNNRLLRAEPRGDSVYYELSHDTLIQPIRKSQRKRQIKTWILSVLFTILVMVAAFVFSAYTAMNYPLVKVIITSLKFPEKFSAEVYLILGEVLWAHGKYDEAEAQYRKATALNPNYLYAQDCLGKALTAQGKHNEAIALYQKMIEVRPNVPWMYVALGDILKKQGKYAEALKQYKMATNRGTYSSFYQRIGDVYYQQGQMDKARRFYRRAYGIANRDYQLSPERLSAKIAFVEFSLTAEQVGEAQLSVVKMANLEMNRSFLGQTFRRRLIFSHDRLILRFFLITCLLYQQQHAEALTELQALIRYYRSLKDVNRGWNLESHHNVISMSDKLSDADKTLLLKLIDILESPKAEGDQKLKELEAALPEILPEQSQE